MTAKVDQARYQTIDVTFEGSAVVQVAVDFGKGKIVYVPVDVLGEAFGRTAAKVFDWCLLDQQATDCVVWGEAPNEGEQVPSERFISMSHNDVFQMWLDKAGWGGSRTTRLGARAIRTAVDELVTAVRRALDGLVEP